MRTRIESENHAPGVIRGVNRWRPEKSVGRRKERNERATRMSVLFFFFRYIYFG